MLTREFRKEGDMSYTSDDLCACVCGGARKMGANIFFSVFAPHADGVWISGSFNGWGDSHPFTKDENGIWSIALSYNEISDGDSYKFKLRSGGREAYITDPYASEIGEPPHFNSVYRDMEGHCDRIEGERCEGVIDLPINIYEMRADKWSGGNGIATYFEMAQEALPYILQMGYTHVSLSGICDEYYDHAHGHGETAYFAPRREQGGVLGLHRLIGAMRSLGIGVLMDLQIGHIPDNAESKSFLTDNALYWLDNYGIDGFLVRDSSFAEIIEDIKSKRSGVLFAATDGASDVDVCLKDCDAYADLFAVPQSHAGHIKAKMAMRAYCAFVFGKMITHMGCENGQTRLDAQENGIDTSLLNNKGNAALQLFISDLDQIYLLNECLWRIDREIKVSVGREKNKIATVECSYLDEKIFLAVDLSGDGGEVALPYSEDFEMLLDSSSPRYGGANGLCSPICRDRLILQPYGAVALKQM